MAPPAKQVLNVLIERRLETARVRVAIDGAAERIPELAETLDRDDRTGRDDVPPLGVNRSLCDGPCLTN